jgi:hypothetical protein
MIGTLTFFLRVICKNPCQESSWYITVFSFSGLYLFICYICSEYFIYKFARGSSVRVFSSGWLLDHSLLKQSVKVILGVVAGQPKQFYSTLCVPSCDVSFFCVHYQTFTLILKKAVSSRFPASPYSFSWRATRCCHVSFRLLL